MQDYGETVSARQRLREMRARRVSNDAGSHTCERSRWCQLQAIGVIFFSVAMLLTGSLILWAVLRQPDDGSTRAPSMSNAPSMSIEPTSAPSPAPSGLRPTARPTPSPTPRTTTSTTSAPDPFCALERLECPSGDRVGQAPNYELRVGQAICNFPYFFGWSTTERVLQWKNCDTNETRIVWDGRPFQFDNSKLSFQLWPNATISVHNDTNQVVWAKHPLRDVDVVPQCIISSDLDCTSILLNNNGDVKINYLRPDESAFRTRPAHEVYFDLYPTLQTSPSDIKDKNRCAQRMPSVICLGERLGHGDGFQLGRNKAICNENYMLGWNGRELELRNCITNAVNVLYDIGTTDQRDSDDYYLILNDDASLQIKTKERNLWRRNCNNCESRSRACLDDPLLPCPFFHLRKTGDIVLNFADNDIITVPWTERNANRTYDNLFSG